MPRKPKRPCRYPGCARLTDGVYCAEHEKVLEAGEKGHFGLGEKGQNPAH